MKLTVLRYCLRRLLEKSKRRRIPLSGPGALQNDDFEIHIEDLPDQPETSYFLVGLRDNVLDVLQLVNGKSEKHELSLSSISSRSFRVTHWYRGWHIEYSSVLAATVFDLLRVNWFRQLLQKGFDRRVALFQDRYELLKILVAARDPWSGEVVPVVDLLPIVYGHRILTSFKMTDVLGDLRYRVESLVDSGDVKFREDSLTGRIVVLPKALSTLADFEVSQQRHRDAQRLGLLQVWIGWGLIVLAAVQIAAQLLDWKVK